MNFNKVVLMGNVTRIPDVRNLPNSATIVGTTGLAVNRKYKDKEETMFIDIVVYGKQAETMGMYVTKGTPLLVEGRLSFRQWDQEGQKRSKHEIIVESFQMVGGKKDSTDSNDKKAENSKNTDDRPLTEEDVPF